MRRPDGPTRPTAALAATTTLLALVAMATVALPGVVASRSDAVVLVTARQLLAGGCACAAKGHEVAPTVDPEFAPIAASIPVLDLATPLDERMLDLPPPTA